MPLSRKELENRIGKRRSGVDRQTDYMDYVNQQVFGFETLEEYKEMIDLLIQLRTPKLSKDFKPSVVNDILSDSLQPLSDEDLRPMSEAIENMDTMNMNLKSGRQDIRPPENQKVLDRYNRLILFGKAQRCVANEKMQSSLEKEIREQVKADAKLQRTDGNVGAGKVPAGCQKRRYGKGKGILSQKRWQSA